MFFKNLQYLMSLFLLVALLTGAGFSGQQPASLPVREECPGHPVLPEGDDEEEATSTPENYWLEPDQAQVL